MKAKKRSQSNYIEMEEVINKPWIDTEGMMILIPTGKNAINNLRKSITDEMDMNNEFYFRTRPKLIPTCKVIEKCHIDVSLIRREANKMRKGLKCCE